MLTLTNPSKVAGQRAVKTCCRRSWLSGSLSTRTSSLSRRSIEMPDRKKKKAIKTFAGTHEETRRPKKATSGNENESGTKAMASLETRKPETRSGSESDLKAMASLEARRPETRSGSERESDTKAMASLEARRPEKRSGSERESDTQAMASLEARRPETRSGSERERVIEAMASLEARTESERDMEGAMASVSLTSSPGKPGQDLEEVTGQTIISPLPRGQTIISPLPSGQDEDVVVVRDEGAITVMDTQKANGDILTSSQTSEQILTWLEPIPQITRLITVRPTKTAVSEEPDKETPTSSQPPPSGEHEDNQASGGIKPNPESTPAGEGNIQKRPQRSKTEELIKAMRLYNNVLQKRRRLLEVQKGVDSLDNGMSIGQVVFTAQALLDEVPLRQIFLIVKYPRMAAFAECLLPGGEGREQAKEIAEELLDEATSRREMANSLYRMLFLAGAMDDDDHRKLDGVLSNALHPPEGGMSSFYDGGWRFDCSEDYETSSDDGDSSGDKQSPPPRAKKPSSDYELFLTFLAAAENADWSLFFDCLRKGANITGRLDTETDPGKGDAGAESTIPQSPLHMALATGEFSLLSLHNHKVPFDKELANLKDETGTPLLHVAALSDDDNVGNVKFLLQQGADVNATDSEGKTVLQCLIHDVVISMKSIKRQKSAYEASAPASEKEAVCSDDSSRSLDDFGDCLLDPGYVDEHIIMIMALITEATGQGQAVDWKKAVGEDGWTVLHVLCACTWTERAKYIAECVQLYGADARELRGPEELSLIDTVVLQKNLPASDKVQTLKVLIQDVNLAPYHTSVHSLRVAIEVHKEEDGVTEQSQWSTGRFLRCSQGVNPEVITRLYDPGTTWTTELVDTTITELVPRTACELLEPCGMDSRSAP